MNYKAVFKLKNGIEGEVKMTAQNDGDVFVLASTMFASQDAVEFKIDKMESIFKPKEQLKKALNNVERAEEQIKMEHDYAQDRLKGLPDELEGSGEWHRLEKLTDKLYDASEYLVDVKKYLQEAFNLME